MLAGRSGMAVGQAGWAVRWARLGRLAGRIEARAGRADAAHDARCRLEAVPDEVARDGGLAPEDATGIATWQPDLPFFMQRGFGKR